MTDNLKEIVAKNLRELRGGAGFTQSELAQRINYSDKAVSKWERGESLPDIAVLKQLAQMYGVTVDWILNENHSARQVGQDMARTIRRNRAIISTLAVSIVWLVATIVFVMLRLILKDDSLLWLAYIAAIPTSCIVLLVFNSIWGKHKLNFVIISALVWSSLLTLCLILSIFKDIWLIFVIGIPAQIIIALCSGLESVKKFKRRK